MSNTPFVRPEDADSPRRHWTITTILDAGKEDTMAVALGKWRDDDGNVSNVIALRWNGTSDNPIGNPQSRGLPTWFIVESGPYTEAIINALDSDMRELVRKFIPKPKHHASP